MSEVDEVMIDAGARELRFYHEDSDPYEAAKRIYLAMANAHEDAKDAEVMRKKIEAAIHNFWGVP